MIEEYKGKMQIVFDSAKEIVVECEGLFLLVQLEAQARRHSMDPSYFIGMRLMEDPYLHFNFCVQRFAQGLQAW